MTERDEAVQLVEPATQTVFQIEGVPLIEQRHTNWCGYTNLAMVLNYWGYNDITPERIFEHLHEEEYDEEKEKNNLTLAPNIDTLASVTRELTPLQTRILAGKDYEKLRDKTPRDVLQTFIRNNIPCIVRVPGHFMVATGIDLKKDIYTFNDPLSSHGFERKISAKEFEQKWDHVKPNYPRDTRHLMLAIYPKRGNRS